jgi:hypothetical protein
MLIYNIKSLSNNYVCTETRELLEKSKMLSFTGNRVNVFFIYLCIYQHFRMDQAYARYEKIYTIYKAVKLITI